MEEVVPKHTIIENSAAITDIMKLTDEWFYTGSWLVNPVEANDIDIVIPYISINQMPNKLPMQEHLAMCGWEITRNRDKKLNHSAHDYPLNDPTIWLTLRKGGINLIIASGHYAHLVWRKATDVLINNKEQYQNKKDRVRLFDNYKYKAYYTNEGIQ